MQINDAANMLLRINPYTIQSIDFSNNGFKRNDTEFEDIFMRCIRNRMSVIDDYLNVD